MLGLIGQLFLAAIILILIGSMSLFVVASAREWGILSHLSREGVITQGELIEATRTKSGRGATYSVAYTFYSDDRIFHNSHRISRKTYRKIKDNQSVVLKIVPFNPRYSRLWDSDFDYTTRNLTSYAAFAGFLVFPPYMVMWLLFYLYIHMAITVK